MPEPRGRYLAGWLAFLTVVLVALRAVGRNGLQAPPASVDGLQDWVADRDPTETAMALLRLVAESGTWYLLAVTGLHLLAAVARWRPVAHLADLVTLPVLRSALGGSVGLGLVVAAAGPAPVLADDASRAPTAAMTPRPAAAGTPGAGTASMRPAGPTDQADTGHEDDIRATDDPAVAPGPAATPPTTWTVERGESFWTIADDVVSEALGRPVTDDEIAPHWRALVEANRDRLVDPADPDTILPGQVFEVPALNGDGSPPRWPAADLPV